MSRRILGGAAALVLGAMLLAPATASADHCRRGSRSRYYSGYYDRGYDYGGYYDRGYDYGYYDRGYYDRGYGYGYRYAYTPRYYAPYRSYYAPRYYYPRRAYGYTRLRHRPRVSLHIGF